MISKFYFVISNLLFMPSYIQIFGIISIIVSILWLLATRFITQRKGCVPGGILKCIIRKEMDPKCFRFFLIFQYVIGFLFLILGLVILIS